MHHWIDLVGPLLLRAIHDKKHHWIDLVGPLLPWAIETRSIIGSILSVPYFCGLSKHLSASQAHAKAMASDGITQ